MYKELLDLGFSNIRNAQVAIKMDEKQAYLICAYSIYEQVTMKEAPYTSSPLVTDLYNRLEQSKDAFYQGEFSGEKFKEWRAWRQSINTMGDPREYSSDSMWFYLYSIGTGHIGISTFTKITDEQVEIVKRFKNVFELSYQRYIDVANAEAQTRESQIELGLERVRARAMAMQKSDELKELIGTVFTELIKLDFVLTRCVIMIFDPATKGSTWWMANSEAPSDPIGLFVQYHELPAYLVYISAWQERSPKMQYVLEGKIKKEWMIFFFLKQT
jgi:hypothetical protein